MKVFPVVHVAVGVFLTYTVIATFFNSTKIQATRSELTVASGPMPWRGNRVLPASSVRQFTTLNYRSANNVEGTARNSSFGLFTVLDDGRTIRLVGGLKDPMEASYLQQQLEKRLNVRPSPF
jgi:hypothetical protein